MRDGDDVAAAECECVGERLWLGVLVPVGDRNRVDVATCERDSEYVAVGVHDGREEGDCDALFVFDREPVPVEVS